MSSSGLSDGLVWIPLVSGHSQTGKEESQEATADDDDGPELATILAMEVLDALNSLTGGIRDVRDESVVEEGIYGGSLEGREQGVGWIEPSDDWEIVLDRR